MSVVKLLYTDAKCPRCGMVWSDVNEWYLPYGNTVWDHIVDDYGPYVWCDCGVEPIYLDAPGYQAVCDRCGQHVTDYGWHDGEIMESMGPTPNEMWECLPDWQHMNGRDLCEDCWWIDDNDEIVERPPLTEKEGHGV